MEELNDDAVTYVILLSAFQVVLNCQLELQGTPYLKGNALQKVREAVNILNLHHARSRDKIWKIDPEKAADIMYSIDSIHIVYLVLYFFYFSIIFLSIIFLVLY